MKKQAKVLHCRITTQESKTCKVCAKELKTGDKAILSDGFFCSSDCYAEFRIRESQKRGLDSFLDSLATFN